MSYETVEAALKTRLETISGLNVKLNDATKIQGGSQKAAILKYSRFEQERWSGRGIHHATWVVDIELYCRYTNDADTRNLLRDTRDSILTAVNAYPHLNGQSAIFDTLITSGERLPELVTFGSFRYLSEVLHCAIVEEFDVGLQE